MQQPNRILIVDDATDIRELLTTVLQLEGYEPTAVDTGQKMLQQAERKRFSLVMLDEGLPDGKGTQFIAALKERQPDIEIIILTGEASMTSAVHALNSGVFAYFIKPWEQTEGLAIIRKALERQRLRQENREMMRALQEELTKRKRVEQQLRASRRTLSTLMSNLPGMAYRCRNDEHWTMEFVSEGAQELTGYGAAELTQNRAVSYAKLIHPDDRERCRKEVQDAIALDVPFEHVYRIRTRGAREKWVWEKGRRTDTDGGESYLEGFIADITNQMQDKERLRLQSSALEAADDAIVITDPNGVIVWINPSFTRLTGYTATEAVGKRPSLLKSGRHDVAFYRELWSTICSGNVWRGELINRRKDGSLYVESQAITPLLNDTGDISHFIGIKRDITKSKRNEEAIRRYANRADALVHSALRLSAQLNLDAVLEAACEAAVNALKLPDTFVVLKDETGDKYEITTSSNKLGDISSVRLDSAISKVICRDYANEDATVILVRDIQSKPSLRDLVANHAHNIRTLALAAMISQGKRIGWLGVVSGGQVRNLSRNEISLLKALANHAAIAIENARLHARVQMQARQMRQMFDGVPEGILLLDSDRRIILANHLGQEYASELASATVGDVLSSIGGQAFEQISSKEWPSGAWPMLTFNDRVFYVASRAMDNGARVDGWVIVISEATEEVMQQKRLETQQRLATVGQLAAGIAHDFNNVLAVITLYSEALISNPDSSSREKFLRTINEQAVHASNLIGQILDFSRASVMEFGPVELLSFLENVVKILQRMLPESITVRLEAEPGVYAVEADATRLQQVIMNLGVNARDAMPLGGELSLSLSHVTNGELEALSLADSTGGDWIYLKVNDTGYGIPSDSLTRVFEPFFTTKTEGQGTGLGLAQVYGIIKQHGGEIDVTSQEGVGTSFRIYLPASPAGASAGEKRSEQILEPLPEGKTVLLAEDNEVTREAIEDALKTIGLNVISVPSGREALAIFRRQKDEISLILSDVIMPEMGGFELYEEIKAIDADARMAFLSGYPSDQRLRKEISEGRLVWLEKPFSIRALLNTINEILN